MEEHISTVFEFEERFNSEKACLEYLIQIRWPNGFCCPRCGHEKAWITKRGLYRCQLCDTQTSMTAGTIFHDRRKPLMLCFRAIWYVVNQKNEVSALGLQKILGLGSYRTA